MDERTALLTGAVVGAAAAFLFFTERGRVLRAQMEPMIGDLSREAGKLQDVVEQIRDSVAGQSRPAAWPHRRP